MEVYIQKLSMEANSNFCSLSKDIFDSLKLSTQLEYVIHLGLSQQACFIKYSEADRNCIGISESIFNHLLALENLTLNIWKLGKHIYLGPVVGILVNNSYIKKFSKNKVHYFLTQHIEASLSEHCLSYFFSVDGIDWEQKKVRGITFVPELNSYDLCDLPLPTVMYDRALHFNEEEKDLVKKARRKFRRHPKVKLINNVTTLGKWEVCEALEKYNETKKYVPETISYTCFEDVMNMLNSYEFIFIKSYYGTMGREVLSVQKLSIGFKLNFYERGAKEALLSSEDELKDFVLNFVGDKKFIIQQGVRLLTYKDRNMDLRIFIMKNEKGKWETIFNGTRIAKGRFTITNTCTGGDYALYELVYPELINQYPFMKVPTADELDEVTIMLAEYIEKELGDLGEVGMDIGIDINGRIWIFEANARPDKEIDPTILDMSGVPWVDLVPNFYKGYLHDKKIQPQSLGIFKYSKFLAGIK